MFGNEHVARLRIRVLLAGVEPRANSISCIAIVDVESRPVGIASCLDVLKSLAAEIGDVTEDAAKEIKIAAKQYFVSQPIA
jgi:hypothetical protein